MKSDKKLKQFIYDSSKSDKPIEEISIEKLLNEINVDELSLFWFYYISERSFSKTETKVPHWKTIQQRKTFSNEFNSYVFQPQKKDINGKYIIEKEELINHIKFHLINDIVKSQKEKKEWKEKPFIYKIPYYSMVTIFLFIPVFLICSVFSNNVLCESILKVFYISYPTLVIIWIIFSTINNKRDRIHK